MSASKRESLLEYLKTLLATITTDNGYNFTVRTIARGIRNRTELAGMQLPAVFITMTHEKRVNITGNQFKADLQVILVGYVASSQESLDSNSTGVELDLDKLIQDVTKALEADRLQGHIDDDPAQPFRVHNTEITDIISDDGDLLPVAGMALSVVFSYASEGVNP